MKAYVLQTNILTATVGTLAEIRATSKGLERDILFNAVVIEMDIPTTRQNILCMLRGDNSYVSTPTGKKWVFTPRGALRLADALDNLG